MVDILGVVVIILMLTLSLEIFQELHVFLVFEVQGDVLGVLFRVDGLGGIVLNMLFGLGLVKL